jgi:hypothetical protein
MAAMQLLQQIYILVFLQIYSSDDAKMTTTHKAAVFDQSHQCKNKVSAVFMRRAKKTHTTPHHTTTTPHQQAAQGQIPDLCLPRRSYHCV